VSFLLAIGHSQHYTKAMPSRHAAGSTLMFLSRDACSYAFALYRFATRPASQEEKAHHIKALAWRYPTVSIDLNQTGRDAIMAVTRL
jgi:hypothetical protein